MGAESKLKAAGAGDKQSTPPLRIPERQGQPATSRTSPPPARDMRPCSGAARVQPRGCKGRSPLHKKTKGGGGRRQTKHATPADSGTARSAGNQPDKPPASA